MDLLNVQVLCGGVKFKRDIRARLDEVETPLWLYKSSAAAFKMNMKMRRIAEAMRTFLASMARENNSRQMCRTEQLKFLHKWEVEAGEACEENFSDFVSLNEFYAAKIYTYQSPGASRL